MVGIALCSYWKRHYFEYTFALDACNASPKLLSTDLLDILFTVLHIASCLNQETHFTANKIHQYTQAMAFTSLIMFSTMLKQLA